MKACATIVMSIMEEPVTEIYLCVPIQFITIVFSFCLISDGSDDQAVLGEKLQCKMKR